MEVEELGLGWTGTQIYNLEVASDLYKMGRSFNNKFTDIRMSNILFYIDDFYTKQRAAFSFYNGVEFDFKSVNRSLGPWWKSFNSVLKLKKEYEIPKALYEVEGPKTWVKEEYQEQWIQCWAYDINASYPAAACDMLPDWENEIEFPGIVEEGECGFIVDCGYLHMVKEGEKASIRFPLKKSPLKPWFDKVARQEWGAKQRGDLVEATKCKLKRNSVIGILRNHNVYVWLYIIEKAKENVMKYVDKNTIAVNIDCIYSKVPRTDLPINNKVGNFKVVDESGLEIYFRGTNYAWRDKKGEQLSPHLRGIPKELQRTYNIEFGTQQREPDYIFNEKGDIVENESRDEKLTCENTREKL